MRWLLMASLPGCLALAQRSTVPSAEAAFGREALARIERLYEPVEDEAASRYLDKLAAALTTAGSSVKVRLFFSERSFAGALPGGFLPISSGLVLATADEDELAAVIAHQAAHIVARHFAELAKRSAVPSWVAGAPGGMCVRFGETSILAPAAESKRRAQEAEADSMARRSLAAAGYEPAALDEIFARLGVRLPTVSRKK